DECDQAFRVVSGDAEAHGFAAVALDQGGETMRHRRDDLVWRQLGARRHDLVAGREDGDLGLAPDRHSCMVRGSHEDQSARSKARSRLEQEFTLFEILPAWTNVTPGRCVFDSDAPSRFDGIFLHDNGVGATRHWRAGENADGLATADAALEAFARE